MSILDSLNALSKTFLGVGIVEVWQQAPQTKAGSQNAEQLAQKKHLREAVILGENAIAFWSKKPGFWERLLCQLLLGNLLDKFPQQLIQWRQQVAAADQLVTNARILLKQDIGNPLETELLSKALVLYQRCSQILHDELVLRAIQQCQQELQKREQFQVLVTQGETQAENRFYKKAIAIYYEAAKLYATKALKQAIDAAKTQVPQEEIYVSALQSAQQAHNAGRLQGAIALLDSALTNFPRADGLDLLHKLQSTVKGRELFRQGLAAEKAGYLPTAASLYENAKSLLPDPTNCRIRLGLIAIKTQDWETALSHLEDVPGEQATYLRGFALAQQDNLQLSYREWQGISAKEIIEQREILKIFSQRNRLNFLQNIEQLVKTENLEQAKIASTEFLQKFGVDPLVESNLNEHILPLLEAGVWQGSDWKIIADKVEKIWVSQPNINTLHNWAVATYYRVQNDPTKLNDWIIALATALANLSKDPNLQDVPWLENQSVNFAALSLKLKRRLEADIDTVKDTNIQVYLDLRDRARLELVALKLMGEPSRLGMKVNDVFITPGCYNNFLMQWQDIVVEKIDSSHKILRSLYTYWGLAVAAFLEGDYQRAIQIKPASQPINEVEIFAHNFVAYHEGSYHLQQKKWQEAVKPLKQAKSEIEDNQNWQKQLDILCSQQRRVILEFSEHLEFAQFWYNLIGSNFAKSYLAEYKAEELRQQVANKDISLTKALDKLQEIKKIDQNNPVVNDLIENFELSQELEEIDRLLKNRLFEKAVRKARRSHRERVRYIVAEFFIEILINGVNNGDLKDVESIQQLGNWAYEICPHEPAFQEVYRGLKIC